MIARVGIVGDVHGQVAMLETALDFLRKKWVDAILCTGDLPIKNAERTVKTAQVTNQCAHILRQDGIYTVCGNHDRYLVENADDTLLAELFPEEAEAGTDALQFARSLPATRQFETPRGNLLLCHGVGKKDTAGIYSGGETESVAEVLHAQEITGENTAIMILGHTHQRMYRVVAGITLINPGTLLHEKESPGFAFADFAAGIVQFYTIRAGRIVPDAAYQWEK